MRDLINQSKMLLDAESVLEKIISRERPWRGVYSELSNLLIYFNEDYDPDYEYVGYLKMLVVLRYELINFDQDCFLLQKELEQFGYFDIRKILLDNINLFEKDYLNINSQKLYNQKDLRKYCSSIVATYSRILVIRVDLGYLQDSHNQIFIDDLYDDLDILLNRIQNRDGIFNHVIGYAWCVEQGGKSKGYHCHLAVIYDTAYRSTSARYWGDKIIQLWKDITLDHGQGYNCYNKKRVEELRSRNQLGIGLVYRRDTDQVANFIEAMCYLTDPDKRTDQYLRVKPEGRRTFGKGQLRSTRYKR